MSKEILNSETVSDVEFILSLYPHLLIDKVSWHPNGTMSVILRISILATVARLACHASDANCDFRIWPVGHNGPIPSDLDNSSRKDRTDTEWGSRIQYQLQFTANSRIITFCVCMAEELVSMNLLERADADRFSAKWGW